VTRRRHALSNTGAPAIANNSPGWQPVVAGGSRSHPVAPGGCGGGGDPVAAGGRPATEDAGRDPRGHVPWRERSKAVCRSGGNSKTDMHEAQLGRGAERTTAETRRTRTRARGRASCNERDADDHAHRDRGGPRTACSHPLVSDHVNFEPRSIRLSIYSGPPRCLTSVLPSDPPKLDRHQAAPPPIKTPREKDKRRHRLQLRDSASPVLSPRRFPVLSRAAAASATPADGIV